MPPRSVNTGNPLAFFASSVVALCSVPWERLVSMRQAVIRVPSAPPAAQARIIDRPGCTVADELLTVRGHLEGLAMGLGGFGVLKTSAQRLDLAIQAAERLDARELVLGLREVRGRLPGIEAARSKEQAAYEKRRLDALLPLAWTLARNCKGEGVLAEQAIGLSRQVSKGRLKREQAIAQLQQEKNRGR